MKHNKNDKRAIKTLSPISERIFKVLKDYEKGDFVGVSELCNALDKGALLVAFSCLSGDGVNQEIGHDIGIMFKKRRIKATTKLLSDLENAGYSGGLVVILDDCEPSRVWQWSMPQEEVTFWCEMLIEDIKEIIPKDWELKLWSEFEQESEIEYEEVLSEMRKPYHKLLVYQQIEYMRNFPNKKLVGEIREASLRRITQYALQGVVLEEICPQAILVQSETPWSVKDPLYNPLRSSFLPIIHPYDERR